MDFQLGSTSVSVIFNQEGGLRLYGRAEELSPLPLLCIRPMLASTAEKQLFYQQQEQQLVSAQRPSTAPDLRHSSSAVKSVKLAADRQSRLIASSGLPECIGRAWRQRGDLVWDRRLSTGFPVSVPQTHWQAPACNSQHMLASGELTSSKQAARRTRKPGSPSNCVFNC